MISSLAIEGLAIEEQHKEVLKYIDLNQLSKLDLAKLTKLVTSLEESWEAAKQISSPGNVSVVSQFQQGKQQPGRGGGGGGQTTSSSPSKPGACSGCGSPKHRKGEKACRATGTMCSGCKQVGHFQSVTICWIRQNQAKW